MELVIIEKKDLFDAWDNLPAIIEVDTEEFERIYESSVRKDITEALATGLVDENYIDPDTGNPRRRHILSATEIRHKINEKRSKEEQINSPNLYFHLQKLEESQLIHVVGQIPKGKRLTTYYGRTAKAFLPKDKHSDGKTKEYYLHIYKFDDFKTLIQRINPEITSEEIDDLIEKSGKYSPPDVERYKQWIEKNQDKFKGLDLDYRYLMNFYDTVFSLTDERLQAFNRLIEILGF